MKMQLDLKSLHLESGAHDSAEEGMCIMEAVAYVAGEEFSDSPQCASPVIAAFLRSYNDSLPDDKRQELKVWIPRLIGSRGTAALEDKRAFMAADWLVRTHTPAWLRLAGLMVEAESLSSLPEITSVRQVPSIMGPLEVARDSAKAAWVAARSAARSAAGAAAWDAARSAAARDAAARAALKPTVEELQATTPNLIERMLSAKE